MAPRILLDLQAAQSVAHGERGIARYSIELTRALLRANAPVDALLLNPNLPNPRRLPADIANSSRLGFATARTFAAAVERGPFAYHVMSPIELDLPAPMVLSRAAQQRASALVLTVYDLIPLIFAERYLANERVREPYLARLSLVRDADLVLAISEHTRRDIIEHLDVAPTKVVNIGGGASDAFRPPLAGEDPRKVVRERLPQVRGAFVLTVGGYEWRKNIEGLIRAYAALPASTRRAQQLVIACAVPPEGEAAWRAHVEACGLRPDEVVITGYVDDPLLLALYQATTLFVFPSRYEGYGLPALEAAKCGAPVITSNNSSLPEILDLPSSTFAPDDIDAMAHALAAGLEDDAFREQLREAGAAAGERHSWDAVAARTLAAYDTLDVTPTFASASSLRRTVRPRLAIVGPLPPVESGIALYNERVLASLDHRDFDIELFHESPPDVGRVVPPIDVPCYPIDALGTRLDPRDYDSILYTVGNSGFHVRTFELARHVPGVVWLHDAYLIGLHLEWALWHIRQRGRATDVLTIFREELARYYGTRIPPETVLIEPLSHRSFVDRQVYLNAGLVRGARHVVLNSELAAQMVHFDAGPDTVLPPITVLRHAVPDERVLPLPKNPTPRAHPLLVALGIVHEIKRPDVLLRAVAQLARPVDVAFVGPIEAPLERELRALAASLGLADRVTFTGFVDVPTYAQWIRDADVAAQLRDVSFGESSGAIHDAIAGGVPVVTSIASASDLPHDVVVHVRPDCSVADLRATLGDVLFNSEIRARMRAASAAYATTWSFDRVAREITRVMLDDARSR